MGATIGKDEPRGQLVPGQPGEKPVEPLLGHRGDRPIDKLY
jgi:hypothetical protein